MKRFDTFESVPGMNPCTKTSVTFALQINEPFRVKSLEGDYAQGKAGDYLMKGVKGELYICDQEIFKTTYRFI